MKNCIILIFLFDDFSIIPSDIKNYILFNLFSTFSRDNGPDRPPRTLVDPSIATLAKHQLTRRVLSISMPTNTPHGESLSEVKIFCRI